MKRRRLGTEIALVMAVIATFTGPHAIGAGAAPVIQLADLDNRLVDPFASAASTKAIVFVFTSVSCPVSNRYAPELRKLYDAFASKGVDFWLVYPNPAESVAAIRAHLKDYGYPMRALRDPAHALTKLAQVTVTPESAVYDRRKTLVYHGRIDDRYVNIGVERPAPTRHDLEEVVSAVLAGKAVRTTATQAIGCFIADFVQ